MSMRALKNLTPFEALTGTKLNLLNLPEWGTKVWVYDDSNSKLEGQSKIGRWVGFDVDSMHTHRIYWPGKRMASVERNIKFDEMEVYIPSLNTPLEGENDSDSDDQESVKRLVETLPERSTPVDVPTPVPASTPIPDPIPRRSQCIGVAYKDGFLNYAILGEIEEEEYEIGGAEFVMGAATGEAEGLEPRMIEEAKGSQCGRKQSGRNWMHYRRRILGMLSNDHLARTLLGPNGSSRSRRTPRAGSPSTKPVLSLKVSPRSMVSTTLRPLHPSPNLPAFILSSPWPLKKTGLLRSSISSAHSLMEISMRRSSCSFHLALSKDRIATVSSPSFER